MRWTRRWRTTSAPPKRTNSTPSTSRRISLTTTRPERWSRGRSIWVMSPVMTIFELKPRRVRNIFICSGLVFCASSRITNESFRVRPRMKASGATSMTLRSRWVATFSGAIMACRPSNRGRGHRHRQERLAGAGRADAERDRARADRVDVALLVDGLGPDLGRAVAPDDVLEDLRGRLVLVQRVGHRGDRALGDLVAL